MCVCLNKDAIKRARADYDDTADAVKKARVEHVETASAAAQLAPQAHQIEEAKLNQNGYGMSSHPQKIHSKTPMTPDLA